MSESIVRNIIKRKITHYQWGNITCLSDENTYLIEEYTVNPDQYTSIILNNPVYFIIVSGRASIEGTDQTYFKGEKISFSKADTPTAINIANCGIIPLVLIKIELNQL